LILTELARSSNLPGEAAYWQSVAEKERDQSAQALKRRYADATSRSYEELRTLGLKWISEKRFEAGIQLLLPFEARWKSDPQVSTAMVRALYQLRRFEEMTELLNASHSTDAESLYFLAAGYRALGMKSMEKLAETNPQSAELQTFLGNNFAALKMFKEATAQYQSAIAIHPDNAELYFGLGEVYYDQRKYDVAAQAYARAVQLDPSDVKSYVMEGNALVRQHRPEQAIALAHRAMQLDPNLPESHAMLGAALEQLGQNREAIRELERAAGTDTDGSLHYVLFNLYRNVGDTRKAEQALLVSNRLKQKSADALANGTRLEQSLFSAPR
jgi:tetratricopeptide (TPR) repeat protein